MLQWLKRLTVYHELFHYGYCGKLDNKPDKALGVYPLRRSGAPYRAFGKLESFEKIPISLLIHYSRNVDQSQYAAKKLFDCLRNPDLRGDMALITDRKLDEDYPDESVPACPVHYPDIATENTRRIKYIDMLVPEPVFVGTDDSGIFEFVIEFELYVEKEIKKDA